MQLTDYMHESHKSVYNLINMDVHCFKTVFAIILQLSLFQLSWSEMRSEVTVTSPVAAACSLTHSLSIPSARLSANDARILC